MMPLMKKPPKKAGKFSLTEVGALIEDLRSQFKAFGEGLNGIREKVDTLTGIVNHEAKKSDLSRIDIANLKNAVNRIEEEIRLIRDNLASKADRKDFETLEKKVASRTNLP